MSTRKLRNAMAHVVAITIIPAALVIATSAPAGAQYTAQPCTVNQAVKPATYICIISQERPPRSVVLETTLSDAEAQAAAVQ